MSKKKKADKEIITIGDVMYFIQMGYIKKGSKEEAKLLKKAFKLYGL